MRTSAKAEYEVSSKEEYAVFIFNEMSSNRVQYMSYNQHITKDLPLSTPAPKHPPSHRKENLSVINGSSKTVNAKQFILYKDDVNTFS